jgi:hypothetical protein
MGFGIFLCCKFCGESCGILLRWVSESFYVAGSVENFLSAAGGGVVGRFYQIRLRWWGLGECTMDTKDPCFKRKCRVGIRCSEEE